MNKGNLAAIAVVAVLGGVALSTEAGPPTKKGKEAWTRSPNDIQWTVDQQSGVATAPIWGNAKKGAYGAMVKFPKGFEAPQHWHTYDNYAVMVTGTMSVTLENGTTLTMTPGSNGFIPGKMKHTTTCAPDADCIFFAHQPGKEDMHMVTPGRTEAKAPMGTTPTTPTTPPATPPPAQ
jgi:quercetin dioxygenase-like cupin family protein